MPTFYEFFAGGGMVRAGLGPNWSCLFANDFDPKKAQSYLENWGADELLLEDIRNVGLDDLAGQADLVWGSFPCQDLSLAGNGAGLRGNRSGTFYPFINTIKELIADDRAPRFIALENVVGTLTSHKGADFKAICKALFNLDYKLGALVVDAANFLPQSRPRLFVIAVHKNTPIPAGLIQKAASAPWHSKALQTAFDSLSARERANWIWWHLPSAAARQMDLADIIEDHPESVKWHSARETTALLSMMSEVNLAKVETARNAKTRMVGTIYKRTRREHGIKVQRAEIRFDDIAGCLRTPAGGSSRQLVMVIEGSKIRSRLMSSRETARLMGLPETYKLPERYNQAYHLTGDGVAVPVVRFIAQHIFEPCLSRASTEARTDESDTLR
ncbi:MAG: DNA cytosine methyltransferase [Planktotalea sp.]|uniref:DNA cytosine methyltransferase n=1 Tax=Planktotalea sp. TaxID=2029877 RepID=UPI003C77C0B4